MNVPTLTIHQPWASLIVRGYKTIETRSHERFRGLAGKVIAIHASQKCERWMLDPSPDNPIPQELIDVLIPFPTGAVLGLAYVEETGWIQEDTREPRLFSEAAMCPVRGRFGLFLSRVVRFDDPVPARGHQGIWRWTPPPGIELTVYSLQSSAEQKEDRA